MMLLMYEINTANKKKSRAKEKIGLDLSIKIVLDQSKMNVSK